MQTKDLNGNVRVLVDVEIGSIDFKDYPEFSDAFLESAAWGDTLKKLTEEELEFIQDNNPELIHELAYTQLF